MNVIAFPRKPQPVDETENGFSSKLNIVEPTVIRHTSGRVLKLIVGDGGSAGAFVLNDAASLDEAGTENVIIMLPAGLASGTIVDLDFPLAHGLVVSELPVGGRIAVSFRGLDAGAHRELPAASWRF